MNDWKLVKWTEAGQVTEKLGWPPEEAAIARAAPRDYFANLREGPRLEPAVFFLGVALPRMETVGWAARTVRDYGEGLRLPRGDADALKAALLWVQDPSEQRRRAAFAAAAFAADGSAERMTAMAAFFSGGSMTPENCAPVPAPPEIAGRFSAGAIIVAANRCPDRKAALNRALDVGEAIAQFGLDGVRA